MRLSIFQKFLLLYLGIVLVFFILISTAGSVWIDQTLIRSTALQLYHEANDIASYQTNASSLASIDREALNALSVYQESQIWIVSTNGTILLNTEDEESVDTRIEGFDSSRLGSNYYMTGNFFGYFDQDMVTVLSPISTNLSVSGYVVIHMPRSAVIADREKILTVVHRISTTLLVLTLLIFFFLYFHVHRPIQKVIRTAQEYASGNLSYDPQIRKNDEFGELAETLTYMAKELNQSTENQKKFISNVSHDFRSPLTSIKGYAEALADGTIPPEMSERYLKIIVTETERLNKLTQSMLTLNKMNKTDFYLQPTAFDINETIKSTAQSFEGTCTERRIHLELIFEGEKQMVFADHDRIQQVLYNLLDNAIKFSESNSRIEIETSELHDKVQISVTDHGIGIPAAYLPKIWDRFYKVDASRGKDRKGTGLGLAIVKEIVQAHGQKITVISTEGVGTTFTFTLAKADTGSPAVLS